MGPLRERGGAAAAEGRHRQELDRPGSHRLGVDTQRAPPYDATVRDTILDPSDCAYQPNRAFRVGPQCRPDGLFGELDRAPC
jgi:hypothetical protein